MVLDDHLIEVHGTAENICISKERVKHILYEELQMRNLCDRWIPHLLIADQKRMYMKISEQCLKRFNKNKADFVRWFIMMD